MSRLQPPLLNPSPHDNPFWRIAFIFHLKHAASDAKPPYGILIIYRAIADSATRGNAKRAVTWM
jgi:hypothetical protein